MRFCLGVVGDGAGVEYLAGGGFFVTGGVVGEITIEI
jgi:hypothetical protein